MYLVDIQVAVIICGILGLRASPNVSCRTCTDIRQSPVIPSRSPAKIAYNQVDRLSVQARLDTTHVCRNGGPTAAPRPLVLLGLSALAERAGLISSTEYFRRGYGCPC